jgi:hypothetical protein
MVRTLSPNWTDYGGASLSSRNTGSFTYGGADVSSRIPGWPNETTAFVSYPLTTVSSEEEAAKNKYLQLLRINGHVFSSSTGDWKCEITGTPSPAGTDRACYQLKFESAGRVPKHLALWVSEAGLHHDPDWKYKKALSRVISHWLSSGRSAGEVEYYG